MKLRDIAFVAAGTIAAAVFVTLGIWQLDRLAERRTFNEGLKSRAETPPIEFVSLPTDTADAHYRRVRLSGRYDFEHEFVVTNRSRRGSPGVNIITPVRLTGAGNSVLVNRGWVYAPDGMTVDLRKWREPETVSAEAYVENFQIRDGDARSARTPNAYRWMDHPTISQAIPYPVANRYVVLIGETETPPADVPPRVPVPPLDEGPHRNYAVQWFSFAAISIFGTILFVRRK